MEGQEQPLISHSVDDELLNETVWETLVRIFSNNRIAIFKRLRKK